MIVPIPGELEQHALAWINKIRKGAKEPKVKFIMPGYQCDPWRNPICESLMGVAYGDNCRKVDGRWFHIKRGEHFFKCKLPNIVYLFLWEFNLDEYGHLNLGRN